MVVNRCYWPYLLIVTRFRDFSSISLDTVSVLSHGTIMESSIDEKLENMKELLRNLESVVVSFSGGFDSSFLLRIATEVLGDRVVALTSVSVSLPERDRVEAIRIAQEYGVRHLLVDTKEIDNPDYAKNPKNRCYYCKTELFSIALEKKHELGFAAVVDGSTVDDLDDFRPGHEAAREAGVRSPFVEVGLRKSEMRELARRMNLDYWDKPSSACLSSRIPYGVGITADRLRRIGAFEDALRHFGFKQLRVRFHDQVARIEVAEQEMKTALEKRTAIVQAGKAAGFTFIALDLAGYRSGSLNALLK